MSDPTCAHVSAWLAPSSCSKITVLVITRKVHRTCLASGMVMSPLALGYPYQQERSFPCLYLLSSCNAYCLLSSARGEKARSEKHRCAVDTCSYLDRTQTVEIPLANDTVSYVLRRSKAIGLSQAPRRYLPAKSPAKNATANAEAETPTSFITCLLCKDFLPVTTVFRWVANYSLSTSTLLNSFACIHLRQA